MKKIAFLAAALVLMAATVTHAAEYQIFDGSSRTWRSGFLQYLAKYRPSPDGISVGMMGNRILCIPRARRLFRDVRTPADTAFSKRAKQRRQSARRWRQRQGSRLHRRLLYRSHLDQRLALASFSGNWITPRSLSQSPSGPDDRHSTNALARRHHDDADDRRRREVVRDFCARPHHRRQGRARELEGLKLI